MESAWCNRVNYRTWFSIHPLGIDQVSNIANNLARCGGGFFFAIALMHEHPGKLAIA